MGVCILDKLDTKDHIDHQRWLMENGFINDLHKDNLYMYGAICHLNIEAVEVRADVNTKTVEYDLYMGQKLLKKVELFDRLSKSTKIVDLWRLKRLIKKEGNLNFYSVLSNFVKDYLGPKWNVRTHLKDITKYEEGFDKKAGTSVPNHKSTDI